MSIILFGYYGYHNVGDDQLMNASIQLFDSADYSGDIYIASGPYLQPSYVDGTYPITGMFNRYNVFAWVYRLCKAKHLVLGGGSLFQSITSVMSLLFYVGVVQLAYFFGCRVVVLCHGWGPFKKQWHERLAMWGLRHAHCSWRTQRTPFKDDPIFCDLTLLLPLGFNKVSLHSKQMGISMRNVNDQLQLKRYCSQHDWPIQVIENQARKTQNQVIQLQSIWNQALPLRCVITDRYHTAIWAIRHQIPFVAISTDPKLVELSAQVNQLCVASIDALKQRVDWEDRLEVSAFLPFIQTQYQLRLKVIQWIQTICI